MKMKNAGGGDELASMGGNHAEDDGAEPEDYAEAIRKHVRDLQQESRQRVKGDEPGFPLNDEDNEGSDPQTHDLQHVGQDRHGPLVQRRLSQNWLYQRWLDFRGLDFFDHALA